MGGHTRGTCVHQTHTPEHHLFHVWSAQPGPALGPGTGEGRVADNYSSLFLVRLKFT